MKNDYKGVIWTNHALDRMRERGIQQSTAWATFRRPDKSRYAKSKSSWIYYKAYKDQEIEVVAKKNEKGEWLIISVWAKDGYAPRYRKKTPTSFFQKLLNIFR